MSAMTVSGYVIFLLTWIICSAQLAATTEQPNAHPDVLSAEESIRSTQVVTSHDLSEDDRPSHAANNQYPHAHPSRSRHFSSQDYPGRTGVGSWKEIELFSRKDPRKARQYQAEEDATGRAGTATPLWTAPMVILGWCWHRAWVKRFSST